MVDRCPCVAPVALRDPSEVLGHGEQKTRQGDGADDEEDEDDLAAQPSRLVWGEGGIEEGSGWVSSGECGRGMGGVIAQCPEPCQRPRRAGKAHR